MKWYVRASGAVLGTVFFTITLVLTGLLKDKEWGAVIGYVMGATMATLVAIITIRAEE